MPDTFAVPSGPDVIILAAGKGCRFGGTEHKSLVPVLYGLGTLPLMLRQLRCLGHGGKVCVVTGHQATTVARAVTDHMPTAFCMEVAPGGPDTLLHSLATAMAQPGLDGPGALVLFADSHYRPDVLARMLRLPTDHLALAAEPWRADADHPVGLRPDADDRITAIGPDMVRPPLMMAPAVYWPRALWGDVRRAADAGYSAQWQVLHGLLREGQLSHIRQVPVATDEITDIDTPADVQRLRDRLLGPVALDYFRTNLCKDERNLVQPDTAAGGLFLKVCLHEAEAAHEFAVLEWLRRQPGEPLVPAPHSQDGRQLTQQHVQGIRLYDLLRGLRLIALGSDRAVADAADRAATTLLGRCLGRLQRMQQALLAWPGAATLPPYPLNSHVRDLLAVLMHLLQLPPLTPGTLRELEALRQVWEGGDASVPFRDATPKNILVAVPALAPHRWRRPHDRWQAVRDWLAQPDAAERVDLVDFDFTSTRHLTAPEDDLISLLGHAGSRDTAAALHRRQWGAADASWLDWLRGPEALAYNGMAPDSGRAARALLVRYLRFGGRKLVYRIVNPAGYAVRFRHDDPAPYFRGLPDSLLTLDPDFAGRWPELTGLLRHLADAVAALPPWHPGETAQDAYLATLHRPVAYWQESPLERLGGLL